MGQTVSFHYLALKMVAARFSEMSPVEWAKKKTPGVLNFRQQRTEAIFRYRELESLPKNQGIS
jgi:hypothetical protein